MVLIGSITQQKGWNNPQGSPLYNLALALSDNEEFAKEIVQEVLQKHSQDEWLKPIPEAMFFLLKCIREEWLKILRKDLHRFFEEMDILVDFLPGTVIRITVSDELTLVRGGLNEQQNLLLNSIIEEESPNTKSERTGIPQHQLMDYKKRLYYEIKSILLGKRDLPTTAPAPGGG